MKVLMILVDGMRPDALANCAKAQEIMGKASYTLEGTTVMPSVTLPCHMSLFHSVDPGRHGTTTNVYMPQVRPIDGLCEVLSKNKKNCAMFFNWEQLRDLTRPGSLMHAYFYKGKQPNWDKANDRVTEEAIEYLKTHENDFAFVYLGYLDEAGHKDGWLSEGYYEALENSWRNIDRLLKEFGEEYAVIITADHGGHDRSHGTDMPEDMTIPMIILGDGFPAGKQLPKANIKDIAPTIVKLLGVEPDEEWEGKPLYE